MNAAEATPVPSAVGIGVASSDIVYLIGTVAIWVGWIALGVTLYRLVDTLMKPSGIARSASWKAVTSSAITAGLGLVLGAALPVKSAIKGPEINLPILWPVFPFAVWAAIACACLAAYRLFQIVVDRPFVGEDRQSPHAHAFRARLRQGILALACGALFFEVFRAMGDHVEIVRGAIPMSPGLAMGLGVLAAAAVSAMALSARWAAGRGLAKKTMLHTALIIGSIVFGIPFFWLALTSFKEDRDMSNAKGLVWIPKVSEEVPYRNPKDPYYQGTFEGATVKASVFQQEPNGMLKLNVEEPMSMEGATFEAMPNQLKEVDRMVPVVTTKYKGLTIVGRNIGDLPDGDANVLIDQPASMAGQTFAAHPGDLEPVRHPGLKWQNYPDSLGFLPVEAHSGLTYLENTLLLVVFNVLGTLFSCSLVAYAFARMKFPGKNLTFGILLGTMMLPAAVTLLPTFLIFESLGWVDTLYPLWVPAFFASAFNVFLLRQFFMTIPKELEDASKIDGCSHFSTFWKIMMPQIKPALAVIFIWTFVGVWNNFMGPLVYINSPEHMPISYAVQLYNTDRSSEPGLLMAFATMSMLPVLILFFAAQRYFIEGVTLSGLGGR